MIATRFNPLGKKGNPFAYEIEYIEATGTQWIHPQVGKLSLGTRIEFECETNSTQFFGANSGSNEVFFTYNSNLHFLGGAFSYATTYNTPYKVVIDIAMTTANLVMEINGTVVRNVSGRTNNGNILLFAIPQLQAGGDGMQALVYSKGKYKNFKVFRDFEPVRSLKPVVDFSGNAVMYDEVEGILFPSQTDPFIGGARKE